MSADEMKRQFCCLCLQTTVDYLSVTPERRPEALYHYCRENGCATKFEALPAESKSSANERRPAAVRIPRAAKYFGDESMTIRERREARAARLTEWADKRDSKASAGFDRASQLAGGIPLGQPILAGHYSQGRDTRYRAKIAATMDRAVADARKAREMRSKAANIVAAAAEAIYSDDDDAVPALGAKLERLIAERARITAYNKSCRAGKGKTDLLSPDQYNQLLACLNAQPGACKGGRMPAYVSQNMSGRISTLRKRLEVLREATSNDRQPNENPMSAGQNESSGKDNG